MKKIVVLVLALLMCLSLVACSDKNDKKSNKYEKYKKYSDIFELLEDGDYDGAINKIQDLEILFSLFSKKLLQNIINCGIISVGKNQDAVKCIDTCRVCVENIHVHSIGLSVKNII